MRKGTLQMKSKHLGLYIILTGLCNCHHDKQDLPKKISLKTEANGKRWIERISETQSPIYAGNMIRTFPLFMQSDTKTSRCVFMQLSPDPRPKEDPPSWFQPHITCSYPITGGSFNIIAGRLQQKGQRRAQPVMV